MKSITTMESLFGDMNMHTNQDNTTKTIKELSLKIGKATVIEEDNDCIVITIHDNSNNHFEFRTSHNLIVAVKNVLDQVYYYEDEKHES